MSEKQKPFEKFEALASKILSIPKKEAQQEQKKEDLEPQQPK